MSLEQLVETKVEVKKEEYVPWYMHPSYTGVVANPSQYPRINNHPKLPRRKDEAAVLYALKLANKEAREAKYGPVEYKKYLNVTAPTRIVV
jgi:hypothetical protein